MHLHATVYLQQACANRNMPIPHSIKKSQAFPLGHLKFHIRLILHKPAFMSTQVHPICIFEQINEKLNNLTVVVG